MTVGRWNVYANKRDTDSSGRTATFVYTPDTYGAVTISATNSGGLIDPAAISFTCVATGYGMTGPSSWISWRCFDKFHGGICLVGGVVVWHGDGDA